MAMHGLDATLQQVWTQSQEGSVLDQLSKMKQSGSGLSGRCECCEMLNIKPGSYLILALLLGVQSNARLGCNTDSETKVNPIARRISLGAGK